MTSSVTAEMLQAMAAKAPDPDPEQPTVVTHNTAVPASGIDLERVLANSGINVHKRKPQSDGSVLFEVDCLTSFEHDDGAYFIAYPDGGTHYGCHHESCKEKRWEDVRDKLKIPKAGRITINGKLISATAESFRERPDTLNSFVDDDEPELIPPPSSTDVMPEMDPAAYHGLAGHVVRAIEPTSEADPVAILVTFLTTFGCAVGRNPHLLIGDSRHGANLFNVLVGETSRSRKGTSQDGPLRLLTIADNAFVTGRIQGGLSSGEGLIWAIRDEIQRFNAKTGVFDIAEPSIEDKRLLCIEEEMSQVLKTGQRQGATISEIIRRAWDSRTTLQTMTKTSPAKATDPHISILGHITKAELSREITETDLANGLANRFGWFCVRRSKLLPDPVRMSDDVAHDLGERISRALHFGRDAGLITRDADAAELWHVAYPELEDDRPGLAGAITARASPMTLRLALMYALLDCSRVIRPEHLEAALAVWDYADASVSFIFGDLTGDAVADRIFTMLTTEGRMTRNDLTDAFGRNVSSARIGHALNLLHGAKRIQVWKVPPAGGKGRPRTFYEAVREKRD